MLFSVPLFGWPLLDCYAPPMTGLDFTPLADALAQLEQGLRDTHDQPQSEIIRDGVIHRFKHGHELSLKFIRRALATVFGDSVDLMPYNDVLRMAAERGLIDNVERWFSYRSAQNKSLHTYDAAVAAEVFAAVMPFLDDARFLVDKLDALRRRSTR